jgi:CheY-like chemotaxis protein
MRAADTEHRCSILVVDDDRDAQELLRMALTGSGYRVACVGHGRDALHHLRSHVETCVILLDLMLPGMDGVQFRRAQLRDRSHAWIPVILMSGALDAERSGAELGVHRVVRKPIDLDELRDAVILATRNCRNGGGQPDELSGRTGWPPSFVR